MLDAKEIMRMCAAPGPGLAYYRPLVCKGALSDVDTFLVGINPATPILPGELDFRRYSDSLLHYDRFLAYYRSVRLREGKSPMSRTRTGIDSFVTWLEQATGRAIAETNVITYPTADTADLRRVPDWVKDKGREIFFTLLAGLEPDLMILHGKDSVEECVPVLQQKGLLAVCAVDPDQDIRVMEARSPLFQFRFRSGRECRVVACRHLMYYGKSGQSFQGFREIVLGLVPH